MFVFWDLVTRPLLGLLAPKRIVEVGSDHGGNTLELLKFARETGAVVHVIDPLPKYDETELASQWGETLVFHKSLSLNVLHDIPEADLVLIDGDHNWYTVRNELELIFKNSVKKGQRFPFVMLHDVAWPYGRRDLYYNPETIPAAYLLPYKQLGMLPGQRELVEEGGLNPHLYNSIYENNLRNGVCTAVEDFVADAGEGYRFITVPAFNGLGILFRTEDYASNTELMRFLETLPHEGQAGAFVERLEQLRIEGDLDRNSLKRRLNAQKEKGAILKAKLNEANTALETHREKASAEIQAKAEALESQRAETAAREAELTGRINALEKDLHDANHQAVLTVQAKVKTIGSLENKLIAAQKDGEAAKKDLDSAKKEKAALQAAEVKLNARLSEAEAQIAGLIGDREALRAALSEAEANAMIAAGEREALRTALSAAEAANAMAAGERETMRAALSAAEAANAVAAGETQALRAALSAAEAASAIAAGERAQKSDAAAIAEQAKAAGDRAKAEAEHKALAFETYSLRSEVAQLKQKLAEAARQRAALENSTMGRVMSRVRATAQANPKLASLVGRTGQLTWWTVSLQLPKKLKSRRELQQALTRIRNSRIFDADWYLERYPDVANAGVDPALHYYQHGGKTGRDPGPHFSGRHYLDSYPEVAQRGANPLLDYLDNGAKAGRKPNPNFDSAYYLQSNPDVARSGMNPLDHWIKRGRAENRKTAPWLETPAITTSVAPNPASPGYVNGVVKPRSTRQTPVDVIIPINGAATDVARLLQEINAWRRPDGQLILVEDGVDASARASIDDFFANNDSAVLVRNVRKRGLAASINQGLSEVAGPYAAVLTSFGPGALKALNTTLTAAKAQSGFTAAPVLITPQMQARPTHTDAPQEGDNTVGFVLSRDALTKVGFFGEEAKFTASRAEWERRAIAASQVRAN